MLILGALMMLAGAGWALWMMARAPGPPVISDAGAVVVAVTAPVFRPTDNPPPTELPPTPTATPTPTLTPLPTSPPREVESSRGLARARQEPMALNPTPTPLPPTPTPTSLPPTPTPTPAGPPAAGNPPDRILAPAINLDAKVLPMNWQTVTRRGTMVSEWIVPANAAGWHANSARPGHNENVVLSGHNNIDGKVFRYLVDLEPGNKVTLYADGLAYEYTVTEKYILKEAGMPLEVRQKNAQWILPSGDERLTLVTCWPYEWPGNSHRVVVVARPDSYFESLPPERGEQE